MASLSLALLTVLIGKTPSTCDSRVLPLPEEVRAEMKRASWREGCPTPLEELVLIQVPYLGFDGQQHQGELVAHVSVGAELAAIFCELLRAGFPIERMRRVDHYGGDDDRSMADNNTSAFNCRRVAGQRRYSAHAFGLAVDVNPLTNPRVADGEVRPKGGQAHVDRRPAPGLIRRGDPCHSAFRRRGFSWGGGWKHPKDYQHFEKPRPEATP